MVVIGFEVLIKKLAPQYFSKKKDNNSKLLSFFLEKIENYGLPLKAINTFFFSFWLNSSKKGTLSK
jgi:hypothetical protein